MSHLLVIDAHAVIHRAYHSIPPSLTYNGQVVNALYGFYSMFLSTVDQLKPKYVVVCMDSPGPTFRDKEYMAYRAQRRPADQDLVKQFPLVKQSLENSAIPLFIMGGYEADDLIATVALQASKQNSISTVTVLTGDKDLMQLVNQKVQLLMPVRGLSQTKTYSIDDVTQRLGVKPDQVVDLKALMGDPSDNYPGVKGVGPKIATSLLEKYENLDSVYQHLDEIKENLRQKLETDKDNAYLSQKLAQLVYDAPIELSLDSALWNQDKQDNLLNIFKSFNFKSLASRLQNKNKNQSKSQPINPQQSLF
ncbi:hypothetical protein DRH14_02435 [Candidatus Shapirobacteria bacterium]|nr:MAG: hypothetical protein DRH14_02435 [Candidatus Shapirobacteria bacterium]